MAHLRQQCHNSKCVIFQDKLLKVLKCYTFLWVQRRHNCSPAASFVNYVMTLYLLKVHLQTFLSIPITQKCQILSYDTLVANERYYVWSTDFECAITNMTMARKFETVAVRQIGRKENIWTSFHYLKPNLRFMYHLLSHWDTSHFVIFFL